MALLTPYLQLDEAIINARKGDEGGKITVGDVSVILIPNSESESKKDKFLLYLMREVPTTVLGSDDEIKSINKVAQEFFDNKESYLYYRDYSDNDEQIDIHEKKRTNIRNMNDDATIIDKKSINTPKELLDRLRDGHVVVLPQSDGSRKYVFDDFSADNIVSSTKDPILIYGSYPGYSSKNIQSLFLLSKHPDITCPQGVKNNVPGGSTLLAPPLDLLDTFNYMRDSERHDMKITVGDVSAIVAPLNKDQPHNYFLLFTREVPNTILGPDNESKSVIGVTQEYNDNDRAYYYRYGSDPNKRRLREEAGRAMGKTNPRGPSQNITFGKSEKKLSPEDFLSLVDGIRVMVLPQASGERKFVFNDFQGNIVFSSEDPMITRPLTSPPSLKQIAPLFFASKHPDLNCLERIKAQDVITHQLGSDVGGLAASFAFPPTR